MELPSIKSLFYKPIKIKHPNEDVFTWSDLHIGQLCDSWTSPLWHTRGYSSVLAHKNGIIENWNSKIKNTSIVFTLGDFVFGKDGRETFLELLSRCNFSRLYVLGGNHYSGYRQLLEESDENCRMKIGDKVIQFCPNYIEAIINGNPVVMSHYFLGSWNGMMSSNSISLWGHSHNSLKDGYFGDFIKKSRCLDVGVEAFPFPPSFAEIKEILKDRIPIQVDHHNKETANPF